MNKSRCHSGDPNKKLSKKVEKHLFHQHPLSRTARSIDDGDWRCLKHTNAGHDKSTFM